MVKRNPSEATPTAAPSSSSADAQVKLATLRKYYELGRRASKTNPDGTAKEAEPMEDLMVEFGIEADTIRKARTFATAYTTEELEQLIVLRDPKGQPLSWYLVRVLLQVGDKAERAELQREAIERGLSRRDLQAAVRRRQGGKRSSGGKRFAVPKSPQLVLTRLVELSESWLRFYEDMGEEGGLAEKLRGTRRRGESTAGMNRAIRETVARLRELQVAATGLVNRLDGLDPGQKRATRAPGRPRSSKSGASEV